MLRRSKIWKRYGRAKLRQLRDHPSLRRFTLWGIALGIIVGFGVTQFSGQPLWSQIQLFSWSTIALSLGAVVMQVFCQTARLWFLFPKSAKLSWKQAAIAFIRGQFIGNWVSTQAGYAVKIWHVRSKSETSKLSLIAATAIVFLDKLLDVILLVLLSVLGGIWLLQTPYSIGTQGNLAFIQYFMSLGERVENLPFLLLFSAIALIFGGSLLLWRAYLPSKQVHKLQSQLKAALAFLKSPTQTMNAALMGIGDWLAEILSLQVLCAAQNYHLSLAQITLCLLILNLGISIPSGIANIGAFEAALTFALTRFGIPLDQSLAIALIYHILQLAGISLWYLITTLWQQKTPTQVEVFRDKVRLR